MNKKQIGHFRQIAEARAPYRELNSESTLRSLLSEGGDAFRVLTLSDAANLPQLLKALGFPRVIGQAALGETEWVGLDGTALPLEHGSAESNPHSKADGFAGLFGSFFGYGMDLAYKRCEIKLLTTGAMWALARLCGAAPDEAFDTSAAWDSLLDAQRYGVNHESAALQAQAMERLLQIGREADALESRMSRSMAGEAGGEGWAAVFNPYPVKRAMFTCIRSDAPLYVYDGDKRLHAQYIAGDHATAVEVELDGLSMKSLRLETGAPDCTTVDMGGGYHFENESFCIDVLPNGRITSFQSKHTGEKLRSGGNVLEALLRHADGSVTRLNSAEAQATARVEKGELFDNVLVSGMLGDSAYSMVMYLPHDSSKRVEIMTDIACSPTMEAAMRNEGSYLRLRWDTGMQSARVLCDEPFGWRVCPSGMPIHSANGIAMTQEGSGVLFDHQGLTRAVERGGTLYVALAVGGAKAAQDMPSGMLDARLPDDPCARSHRYFYAIDITDTDAPHEMFGRILFYQTPMLPVRMDAELPPREWFSFEDARIIPTAIEWRDGRLMLRAFNASCETASLLGHGELRIVGRGDALGRMDGDASKAKPFEVFTLFLAM